MSRRPDYAAVSFTRFQSTVAFRDCCPYVSGESDTRQSAATFRFKAGSADHTGGGYPRWRSYERGAHAPGATKRTVFVPVHRLLALVACVDAAVPIGEAAARVGSMDVHHEMEMPSANLPDELELLGHAEHAEITQAKRRAWARDRKQTVEEEQQSRIGRVDYCSECGDEAEATVAGTDYCLDCAMAAAKGRDVTIEM
jgi:RNA polymerase-binding transcription factor DksA